ncbi:hypothetical protein JHK85_011977 [Glycine max]|nr:hypothetical protein JHK87_011548 [Glycine soja]KAG5039501.1 hypothetical protein JHK85_011977 [Glycine max]KAG5056651.1 hypothetical protein JHK86_011647 [Glycine max]KHN48645.1 hypothetical protein glysoja_015793 [Glycine soja]
MGLGAGLLGGALGGLLIGDMISDAGYDAGFGDVESINPNCGVNPRRRKKRKDETFGPEGDERNVREAVQVLLRQRVPRQARHQRRLLLHNLNKMGNRFVFFAI